LKKGSFWNKIFSKSSKYYGIKDECCIDKNIEHHPDCIDNTFRCKTCERIFTLKEEYYSK